MTNEHDEHDFVDEMENIPNETRNEAFLRLVNKRLPVAVKRIRMVRNLSAKTYEYTPEQAASVIAVLRLELEELERDFASDGSPDDVPTIT